MCHPIEDIGPKTCLSELNPFTHDSHVALSILTLPNQQWLYENTRNDADDDVTKAKIEQYRQKSISDIEAEIKRHVEFYSMNLAPKLEGIIVITDDGPPIWIADPFTIPPDPYLRSKIIEVIFVMEKCKGRIFSAGTAKNDLRDVLSLITEVAKNNCLYYDFSEDNLCKSPILKLIDFDDKYIAGPDIVNSVNSEHGTVYPTEPTDPETLMIHSMWLIFIMSVYKEYQTRLINFPNTKYPSLLYEYTPGKIKTNLRAIIEYLLLYESSTKEISPLSQLYNYTWSASIHDIITTDEEGIQRTRIVLDENNEMLEVIIGQIHKDLISIADNYRSRLYSRSRLYDSDDDNGGSKRKTRRRTKKRGKKGKTRRR